MYSLIIPVYKNEASLFELINVIKELNKKLNNKLEIIFVVDGSPDASYQILDQQLSQENLTTKLLLLSKNFGSFAAIRAGLNHATGPYFAVMAADLQEPPELIFNFFKVLENEPVDVVIGAREKRDDPLFSRLTAKLFWFLYRKLVQKEIPANGADVFGCNEKVKNLLISLNESNSTLVGLLFWIGFRRKLIGYHRIARKHNKSAWSFSRKLRYLNDSVFAFSDLPIRLLTLFGSVGILFSSLLAVFILIGKMAHFITVPGYAGTLLTFTFFAAINSLGLGIVGSYVWRTFENTKNRPLAIIMSQKEFNKETS